MNHSHSPSKRSRFLKFFRRTDRQLLAILATAQLFTACSLVTKLIGDAPTETESTRSIHLSPTNNLPVDWDWVVSGPSGTPKLVSFNEFFNIYKPEEAKPIPLVFECTDAPKELSALEKQVLAPSGDKPSDKKYFTISQYSYHTLDFSSKMTRFDAKLSVVVPSPDKPGAGLGVTTKKVKIGLTVLYSTQIVEVTPEYVECLKRSLTSRQIKGKIQYPSELLVGGLVAFSFDATRADGGAFAKADDIVSAELRVDFNKIDLSFQQWGKTNASLTTRALVDPLNQEPPNPLGAVSAFENAVLLHNIIAVKRQELDL